MKFKILLLILTTLWSSSVFAWGDLGHYQITELTAKFLEKEDGLGDFLSSRRFVLGYMGNVPDIIWKQGFERKKIAQMDHPSHQVDLEAIMGTPEDYSRFLSEIRNLPANYVELKKQYEGKPSPLKGTPKERQSIDLYRDVGTAPWRVRELYFYLVEAFRCLKEKQDDPSRAGPQGYTPVLPPFSEKPNEPSYVCKKETTYKADLVAAFELMGILAHYTEDLSQPLHVTSDFDGWVTGNGGLHSYFENEVVAALDEKIGVDALTMATAQKTNRAIRKSLSMGSVIHNDPHWIAKLLLNLAMDSYKRIPEVKEIDDTLCIKKGANSRSTELPWGLLPFEVPKGSLKPAQRIPVSDPKILHAFRPIIVQRFATAIVTLSEIWKAAWEQGGKPRLENSKKMPMAFPEDPPYIWPHFQK